MKSNLFFRIVIIAVFIGLGVLGGCQQSQKRSLVARYIVPPKVVRDVSSLQNLVIAPPRITLTANYGGKSEQARLASVFTNCLNQRLTAGIYEEHFFNVQDELHGNPRGLAALNKHLAHAHGYSIKPAPILSRAQITTRANIQLSKTRGKDRIVTQLVTIPYTIEHSDDGVPYAVPNTEAQTTRDHVSEVPFVKIVAKGQLRVQLRDTEKHVVYDKVFKDLTYEKKVGGDSFTKDGEQDGDDDSTSDFMSSLFGTSAVTFNAPDEGISERQIEGKDSVEAMPTVLEIASALFDKAIDKVIKDISPHKEERTLFVNENGDTTAVVLMKATAFSEAYKRLCDVVETHDKVYAGEAGKIKRDFAERIQEAQDAAHKEQLQAERKAALTEAGLSRSPDYENMAIVCEAMGILDEALEFYERAAEADPANEHAAQSLARLKALTARTAAVSPQRPGGYDEKENKER